MLKWRPYVGTWGLRDWPGRPTYQVKAVEFVDVCRNVGEWSSIEVQCIIAYDQWRAEVQSWRKSVKNQKVGSKVCPELIEV